MFYLCLIDEIEGYKVYTLILCNLNTKLRDGRTVGLWIKSFSNRVVDRCGVTVEKYALQCLCDEYIRRAVGVVELCLLEMMFNGVDGDCSQICDCSCSVAWRNCSCCSVLLPSAKITDVINSSPSIFRVCLISSANIQNLELMV